MKRSLGPALILVSMSLAACGGSTSTTAQKTTVHDSQQSTPPQATSGVPTVNPCSLLTRHQAAVALGARASAGRHSGGGCEYAPAVGKILTVTLAPATAAVRTGLSQQALGSGAVRVSEPGLTAIVTRVSEASPTTPAQSEISFIKGQSYVSIVLTDASKKTRSLTGKLVALARAVVRAK